MHQFARKLFPLCRSITGNGLRSTLKEIQRHIPLVLHEVPTGTPVLDWEVPMEWNATVGRIETLAGRTVVDFADCNLHLVGYSTPVDKVVSRAELAAHVHTLPDQPDLVPYRTAYYAGTWGFCLADQVWKNMQDPAYRVRIESSLQPGSLTYGELAISGSDRDEMLISVHCCHPSLANDNLSGIAMATEIARRLLKRDNRLTYRLLFIPATIGSLTWLARNEDVLPNIRHGLVLSCVGDNGAFTYKQSRRGNTMIDRAAAHVLRAAGVTHKIQPFHPYGYDERQFCSPGFDLPVGCFMRSANGTFPEYHTSADNIDFITPAALEESLHILMQTIDLLERDVLYKRVDGRGEPQLGRRGLYRTISGQQDHATAQLALLWVLNQADGRQSLLDIAERAGMAFDNLAKAADTAREADLIRRCN
jgi:aminopeptidase-like protein